MRILMVGLSARAAAESAAMAGYAVTAFDAFGDLDQHPSVRARAVRRDISGRFSAAGAARAAQAVECDAVVYLSGFENQPMIVERLAVGRTLWGNPARVLRRVRNPFLVAEALRRRGRATAAVHRWRAGRLDPPVDASDLRWLVKPFASGGGHRVHPWHRERVPPGCYVQELVEGTPGSIVFVAANRRAVPIGMSRQLIGLPTFGAAGFRYCGSILTAPAGALFDDRLVGRAFVLSTELAEEFDLVGVGGIDFIVRDGVPYATEVNPRWCASMELVERAFKLSVFSAHARACGAGVLPQFDLRQAGDIGAVGKAIVFARSDVVVGDTREWLVDPMVRDVPHPGERIHGGSPVCTVLADAADPATCYAALVRRAENIYARLSPWMRAVACQRTGSSLPSS
jgi:predicted ATP-grasp superfamily ATP-dependent carboligase